MYTQVYDTDLETVFQVLFTDSDFMKVFLHSRGTTSKHNNNKQQHNSTTSTTMLGREGHESDNDN